MRRFLILCAALLLGGMTAVQEPPDEFAQLMMFGMTGGPDSGVAVPFSTFNPATLGSGVTLSNGNDTVTGNTPAAASGAFGTSSKSSGKLYFEGTFNTVVSGTTGFGLADSSASFPTVCANPSNAFIVYNNGLFNSSGVFVTNVGGGNPVSGQTVGFEVDLGAKTLSIGNVSLGSTFSAATDISAIANVSALTIVGCIGSSSTDQDTLNVGASAFVIGSIPGGFSAWH